MDSLGSIWIHLDSLGLTWTHLDSLEFTSTHQSSLELTRFHQDSLEPHKARKQCPLTPKGKGKGSGPTIFPSSDLTTRPWSHMHERNETIFPVALPPISDFVKDWSGRAGGEGSSAALTAFFSSSSFSALGGASKIVGCLGLLQTQN